MQPWMEWLWRAGAMVGVFLACLFLGGFVQGLVQHWRRLLESGPLGKTEANNLYNFGLLLTRGAVALLLLAIVACAACGWPVLPWLLPTAGVVAVFVWRVKKMVRARMDRSVAAGGEAETDFGMGDFPG